MGRPNVRQRISLLTTDTRPALDENLLPGGNRLNSATMGPNDQELTILVKVPEEIVADPADADVI